jgi:hypothetical protein
VFVIELHSRRVQVRGSTPNSDEAFVVQTMRHLTDDVESTMPSVHAGRPPAMATSRPSPSTLRR